MAYHNQRQKKQVSSVPHLQSEAACPLFVFSSTASQEPVDDFDV